MVNAKSFAQPFGRGRKGPAMDPSKYKPALPSRFGPYGPSIINTAAAIVPVK